MRARGQIKEARLGPTDPQRPSHQLDIVQLQACAPDPPGQKDALPANLKGAMCGPFSASASVRSVTKQNFFSPDIHLYIYTGLKISQRMRNGRRKGLPAYTASTGLPGFS